VAEAQNETNGVGSRAIERDSEDKAKYDALSADEKAMLADVTSAATISLKDSHGDLLGAIKKTYELREEINLKIK